MHKSEVYFQNKLKNANFPKKSITMRSKLFLSIFYLTSSVKSDKIGISTSKACKDVIIHVQDDIRNITIYHSLQF